MAEPAAAPKMVKVGNVEIPETMLRARTPQTRPGAQAVAKPVVKTAVAAPVNNPIFKIYFVDELEPEARRDKLAAYLSFVGTKAETREHMKAREEFEDYLSAENQSMSEEFMRLTDTDTFAILQGVFNDMNSDLLVFEEEMKPLTDILSAIYTLQTKNKAIDAFREIQTDKKNEAIQQAEREASERESNGLMDSIRTVRQDIAVLGEEKQFFGFGNVKAWARKDIAAKSERLTNLEASLEALRVKLAESVAPPNDTELAEYANEKQQLRNLLDISKAEHSDKVKSLVDGALRFVQTSSARVGEVREHFSQMGDRMEHLKDANGKMCGVRAVMSEALTEAKTNTMTMHGGLATVPADENTMRRIDREEKLEAVEDHVKALDVASRNNTVVLAELTGEAISIRVARDQHEQMLEKTRMLHTQGIAGVASRLNTTITGVSMAALNESSKIAGQTLRRLIEDTNEITAKEVIKSAMGVQETTSDVQTVLDDLASIGETLSASSQIYRTGLADLHETLDKARDVILGVQGDIKTASAIHADAENDTSSPNTEAAKLNGATPPPASASPFAPR